MGYFPNEAIEALTAASFQSYFTRDFPYLPSYAADKAYFVDDKIFYETNSNFYKCIQNCTGIAPDDTQTITPATSGKYTCGEPASLETLKAVNSRGGFDIVVDDVTHNVRDLDLSSATSYDEIADLITAKTSAYAVCTYNAAANDGDGGFVFTSISTGADSKVAELSGGNPA